MTMEDWTLHGTGLPPGEKARGNARSWTWEELLEWLHNPDALAPGKGPPPDDPKARKAWMDARKTRLAGWSPTRFKGNQRKGENVEAVGALVLDLDSSPGEPLPRRGEPDLDPERLRAAMTAALPKGTAWAAHTTPSSRPAAWRWRVVVPLSEPVNADTHRALTAWLRLRLATGTAPAMAESDPGANMNTAGLWYAPARDDDNPAAYTVESCDGDPLHVESTLASLTTEGETIGQVAERLALECEAMRDALWPYTEEDREELEKHAPTMADAYGLDELERDRDRAMVSIAHLPRWEGYDKGEEGKEAGHGIGEDMNRLIGGGLCLPYVMLIGARHAGAGKTTFLCQVLDGLALRSAELVREGKPGPLTPVILLSEMPAALLTWRTLGRWTGRDSRLFRAGKNWKELGIDSAAHAYGWPAAREALAPDGHLGQARRFQRVTNNPPHRGVDMVEWLRRMMGTWQEALAREHGRDVWPVVALDPIQRWKAAGDNEIKAQSDLADAIGRAARKENWICFATSDTNKDSATGRERAGKDDREIGTAAFRGSYELQHAADAAVYLNTLRVTGEATTPKGTYLMAGLVKNWWGEDLPSPKAWAGFRWYRSTGRFYPYNPGELLETRASGEGTGVKGATQGSRRKTAIKKAAQKAWKNGKTRDEVAHEAAKAAAEFDKEEGVVGPIVRGVMEGTITVDDAAQAEEKKKAEQVDLKGLT